MSERPSPPKNLSRRALLRLGVMQSAASLLPLHSLFLQTATDASAEFVAVPSARPSLDAMAREPAVRLPPAAISPGYDIFDNHWCLSAADAKGLRSLMVLPAQAPETWVPETASALPEDAWRYLAADEFGYVWVATAQRLLRLDPHHPEQGWMDLSKDVALSGTTIAAMGIAPSGAVLLALAEGALLEVDYTTQAIVRRTRAPKRASIVGSDSEGRTWLRGGDRWYRREAAADAWQRSWESIGRLPGGNHDLAGDTLGGDFVMAGGQNAGWGYPAKPHVFDEIFRLSAKTQRWTTLGRLRHPRFYNGTTVLAGEVWIIGGNRRDADGVAHFLDTVEICDPQSGLVREGPRLPSAIEMPVSLRVGNRIYVAGGVDAAIQTGAASHVFRGPGKLWSIGAGESVWRREPDAPVSFNPLAGAVLGKSLYLAVPKTGLCRFDTVTGQWEVPGGAIAPRSPQMAVFQGEVWLMGGRGIVDVIETLIYNPVTRQWRKGASLPRELAWGAGGVLHGRLMVVGGAGGRGYSNRTFLLR